MLFNDCKNQIWILHENEEWIPPFKEAFARVGASFGELFLDSGQIDLDRPAPKGVFWSRLSASSHTRGHAFSKEFGRATLAWLENSGRRVVNGSSVLELEVSKIAQHLALKTAGFVVPKTRAVFSKEELFDAVEEFYSELKAPFITKHNQGGKGLGVKLFDNPQELKSQLDEFDDSADGIFLLQEYVRAKAPFITRAEFVGGEFCYAVRVDTSDGGFELCPAEACDIDRAKKPKLAAAACSIGAKFEIRNEITAQTPIIASLQRFLAQHKVEIAGVEFIENTQGEIVVYDINTNTNYNKAVEEGLRTQGKKGAADKVVEFLLAQLDKSNSI